MILFQYMVTNCGLFVIVTNASIASTVNFFVQKRNCVIMYIVVINELSPLIIARISC